MSSKCGIKLSKSLCLGLLCFALQAKGSVDDFADPGDSLSKADFSFIGVDSNESGYSISSLGDVNGDGYDDILIGAPADDEEDTDAGKAYIISGSRITTWLDLGLTEMEMAYFANVVLTGEAEDDGAGYQVAKAGDVDGDGLQDILIAKGGNGDDYESRVYLFLGDTLAGWMASSATKTGLDDADYIIEGLADDTAANPSITTAGDVDADGLDDLLIGIPLSYEDTVGKSYLLLGDTIMNDLNDGSTSRDLRDADLTLRGDGTADGGCRIGSAVSNAGDIDGDGYDDILIGAPDCALGLVYVVMGSTIVATLDDGDSGFALDESDMTLIGETAGDECGSALAAAGDIDVDGYADILIGASEDDDGGADAGKAYVMMGSTIRSLISSGVPYYVLAGASYTIIGEDVSDNLGASISGIGDVDDDGKDDILIGAPNAYGSGMLSGKSYLVLGSTISDGIDSGADVLAAADANYAFKGEKIGDSSGYSVSGGGDINGDGAADLLIGAYGKDETDTDDGKTYLILGTCTEPTDTVYVDTLHGHDTGTGSEGCPLATINDGIDLAYGLHITNVVVRGGYYPETVHMFYGLNLVGEQQEVNGSNMVPVIVNTNMADYVVYGAGNSNFKFFGILDGGIYLSGVTYMLMQENWVLNRTSEVACITIDAQSMNNTVRNNLLINWVSGADVPALKIGAYASSNNVINNVMHRRGVAGYKVSTATAVYLCRYSGALGNNAFYNNILYEGSGTMLGAVRRGFYAESTSVGYTIKYNYMPTNNVNVTIDSTNLKGITPGFKDPYTDGFNYRLDKSSPCINAGRPYVWLDANGTRNDMGCYGGPNSFDQEE